MNDGFGEGWRDLAYTPAADSWITRPLQRAPEPERDEPRYGKRGDPFAQAELDKYFAAGGKADYGDTRYAKQVENDRRYEARRRPNQKLFDIVVNVVAAWDSSRYLEKHRRIAGDILSKARNQRRRKLAGLSTKERRHQQAIRMAHALAFDNISQAEYCRRHHLDPAGASRMLAHLYEKEPGLNNAIDAIRATAAATSWQNQQQSKKFPHREREVDLIFGWIFADVEDNGWITDYDAGSIRSINGGRFKPCALLRDVSTVPGREDAKPIDLHEPATWHNMQVPRQPLVFAAGRYCTERLLVLWSVEPARKVERYLPQDRDRELSRKVRLKNGKSATLKPIARGEPSSVRDGKALVYQPRPGTDLNFWSPEQMRYRRLDGSHDYVELRDEQAPSRVVVLRTDRRRLCNPVRWIPLTFEPTGSAWFPRFSKIAWTFQAVKETSDYTAVRIGSGLYRIFLPRP